MIRQMQSEIELPDGRVVEGLITWSIVNRKHKIGRMYGNGFTAQDALVAFREEYGMEGSIESVSVRTYPNILIIFTPGDPTSIAEYERLIGGGWERL